MPTPFSNITKQSIQILAGVKIYQRGEEYYISGNVRNIRLEDNILYATVIGNYGGYKIQIQDNPTKLTINCTCPYEGYCCKHIVAVLLTFLAKKKDILKKARQTNQGKDDIKVQLVSLTKEELADLLILSLQTHKNWKSTLLKALSQKMKGIKQDAVQDVAKEHFYSLFDKVCQILEEHNEYGGGEDEEEDEAIEMLNEIVKLSQDNLLSEQIKKEFIDKMFHYFDWDNSILTDPVWEAIYGIAKTREEWLYVIEKVQVKKDTYGYREGLVQRIRKEKLKERMVILACLPASSNPVSELKT